MDSVSLLERENEFKKLNKQLEKKTEILMKEIENAMAKKDIFSDFSCNLKLSPRFSNPTKHKCDSSSTTSKGSSETSKTLTPKQTVKKPRGLKKPNGNIDKSDGLQTVCLSEKQCHCCSLSPNRDLEFLYAFVSISVKDDILPQSFTKEKINVESVCKCLASKVKLLQEQIDKLKENINIKSRQCSAQMRQLAELEGGRLELQGAAHAARADAVAARAKCQLLQNKLDERDKQLRDSRAACESLSVEVKRARARCGGLEARAAQHEDQVAALRQQLQAAAAAEKEYRDTSRASETAARAAAAQQQQRLRHLQTTVERQARLVANLRRQLALTAASSALGSLEKDYNEFLTQDF
ncbi:uncharacterized protein LOC121739814 [Aricia agestis]|uniref:uncharacterized protein LOC121739814 n=1 Tax=Aricia agestis TaxID=91739 RepID=UPI001C201A8C|nr:uncharacterized protein LOC121739814 [Aricia agestis]